MIFNFGRIKLLPYKYNHELFVNSSSCLFQSRWIKNIFCVSNIEKLIVRIFSDYWKITYFQFIQFMLWKCFFKSPCSFKTLIIYYEPMRTTNLQRVQFSTFTEKTFYFLNSCYRFRYSLTVGWCRYWLWFEEISSYIYLPIRRVHVYTRLSSERFN